MKLRRTFILSLLPRNLLRRVLRRRPFFGARTTRRQVRLFAHHPERCVAGRRSKSSPSESDVHRKLTGSLMAAYEVLGSG